MIRSLYVRVALTFMLSVILGLIIAFYASNYWFRDMFESGMQKDLSNASEDIAAIFREMKGVDMDAYLHHLHWVQRYYITVFDEQLHRTVLGPDQPLPEIPQQAVDQVLKGQQAAQSGEPIEQWVGRPLSLNGHSYAVFVQPVMRNNEDNFRYILFTVLAITLIMGSLFVLIAARYLVQPLKLMTRATQRISKGDFDITFTWLERKDEVGELARSFSQMAGELKQLELMRQDFVSSVSHEIQSPLTSIAGFSKMIRYSDLPEEERNHYLDIIQTESERLSRLSENLLSLASLESEHHPFHPVVYRLDEQIRRIIVTQEPIWSAKRLDLQLNLPPVMLSADEDQLSQVWINLLHNAIKFTPEGGVIRVKLEALVDRVQVTVHDSGIGMGPEELAHIFDRFYKADRARQREVGGSGLGLAIVRKIVDLHCGIITVDSKPGQGSLFKVMLPGAVKKRNAGA
ncbi:Alkaline phosphatase synthesis sensor protein PhoR [Paenibacillus konkukensis]|uniref:Heme sensor protein HssS n=1 Tax=Paenibacillus konkukensis TaxID=2020716 RepID=A0ABY4RNL2_9BACL|nr:sensor histidine kinase [Paenibacillus konkukensis]UQZ83560.1 Alkaline phosphatase synthesis sensor protein PhoR [Paenibacillus konkukensis]